MSQGWDLCDALSPQKSPPSIQDRDEGVAGKNERKQYHPRLGVIGLPSKRINDFLPIAKQNKNGLVARPVGSKKVVAATFFVTVK